MVIEIKQQRKMQNKHKPYLVLFNTFLFTLLFYHQQFGLNLLIFEIVAIGMIWLIDKPQFRSVNSLTVLGGTLLTALLTVLINTTFVLVGDWDDRPVPAGLESLQVI